MKKGFVIYNQIKIITLNFLVVVIFISLTPFLILYANASSPTNLTLYSIAEDNLTKINVVSSVAPITNIIKNIGGDKINLI
ncbi:MAG TPA: hypothetical protein VFK40_09150, partial [Nitrososphaeraceae archaeon]|nr:hypothetical protein [Nitrososphaeraceae archaeon]